MSSILDFSAINTLPVTTVGGIHGLSLRKTFDCGQTFRFDPVFFSKVPDFLPPDAFTVAGCAFGKTVLFSQRPGEDSLTAVNVSPEEWQSTWESYFDLAADYQSHHRAILAALPNDSAREVMTAAIDAGRGIRILRQEPWETLISFILSQNNNIPRIKKIIRALTEALGQPAVLPDFPELPEFYTFPTPEAILRAGLEGLAPIRAGFRAKYILDAAERVCSGALSLDKVAACGDFSTALDLLKAIKGVGDKVGACVLLFGFGYTEAFPVDVWMKKSLARHFPEGIDTERFGSSAGLAQQYLFYYERYAQGN